MPLADAGKTTTTYRLSLAGEVPDELRRCGAEELADAAARLRAVGTEDPVEAVHEARKDIKKTRSLLRLARSGLGKKAYRAENDRLRAVARDLSNTRDADVMIETVDALAKRFAGQLPKKAFDELRRRFRAEAGEARSRVGERVLDDVLERLDAATARVDEWPVAGSELEDLRRGATRGYRRGRKAMRRATREPSVENLHAWRKRVKDLWYHHRLLGDAWPEVAGAYAREAHTLSDLLGDDHDVAVLADRLTDGSSRASGAPIDDEAMLELLAHRRHELQREAFRLGRRVYLEPPKAFERRLRGWLRIVGTERESDAQVAG